MGMTNYLNPDPELDAEVEQAMAEARARVEPMTDAERAAERRRLQAAVDGAGDQWERMAAESGLRSFDALIMYLDAIDQNAAVRRNRVAEESAETALGRCTYLGGIPGQPGPVPQCSLDVMVGHHVVVDGNRLADTLVIDWADIRDISVDATDRASERVTGTRIAALGPFAWAFKKQRREAALVIETSWGEAIFLVHGRSPLELRAALAPLTRSLG